MVALHPTFGRATPPRTFGKSTTYLRNTRDVIHYLARLYLDTVHVLFSVSADCWNTILKVYPDNLLFYNDRIIQVYGAAAGIHKRKNGASQYLGQMLEHDSQC